MSNANQTHRLQEAVCAAHAHCQPLEIIGGGSKRWHGRVSTGERLDVSGHTGILNYQPTELVLTARAGTKLSEITSALDEHGQRLGFDPPHFGGGATLGGAIACGLSGPRRPYAGSARDFVLGCNIINGRGEVLRFGGEVMKNVAGFDVARLMAGCLGTLGVLLNVSLKVLPHRIAEHTVTLGADFTEAIRIMNRWASTPLPITAMMADGRHVYFRICATPSAVSKTMREISGARYDDGLRLWKELREHRLSFFDEERPLWRLSVPANAAHPIVAGTNHDDWLIGWGGAQRWLKSKLPAYSIFQAADSAGGHASLFRGGDRDSDVFAPLPAPLFTLHKRLKEAFDPTGILNPGRMYRDL
ncbi:MAG: glycolate oxidase subunit GlcE [Mariprofundaceae bacterium]